MYCVRAPAIIGDQGSPVAGAQAADADARAEAVLSDLEPEDLGRRVAQPQEHRPLFEGEQGSGGGRVAEGGRGGGEAGRGRGTVVRGHL